MRGKWSDDDKRDRYGHNHNNGTGEPSWSRVKFMAQANGYVMARRPGCTPFVITGRQWLDFPIWHPTDAGSVT